MLLGNSSHDAPTFLFLFSNKRTASPPPVDVYLTSTLEALEEITKKSIVFRAEILKEI